MSAVAAVPTTLRPESCRLSSGGTEPSGESDPPRSPARRAHPAPCAPVRVFVWPAMTGHLESSMKNQRIGTTRMVALVLDPGHPTQSSSANLGRFFWIVFAESQEQGASMNRFLSLVLAAGVSLVGESGLQRPVVDRLRTTTVRRGRRRDETLPASPAPATAACTSPIWAIRAAVQRLPPPDAQGNEQWVHGGILIYDAGHHPRRPEVTTDADDNAVIVYR